MAVATLTINGELVSGGEDQTILEVARDHNVVIPTLCHLEGLSDVGACRLCVVDIAGNPRPQPACLTVAVEGMQVTTESPQLQEHRRMLVELLLAERNHVCAVCVANGNCELQNAATTLGIDHVRFEYQSPDLKVDSSHERFVIDHNRCILCTRCVRVCDEIEGAHTWDVMGRGTEARIVSDLNQPWGTSDTCTSCGKCVQVCPTGALFEKGKPIADAVKDAGFLTYLKTAREKKLWGRGRA
jgi:bidirectional [NiFe] hydrogenase diaphorase subunit